jgi:hypothetical protein
MIITFLDCSSLEIELPATRKIFSNNTGLKRQCKCFYHNLMLLSDTEYYEDSHLRPGLFGTNHLLPLRMFGMFDLNYADRYPTSDMT